MPAQRSLAVVALWHPKWKEVAYYLLRALPFGARNAVFIFGCIARTLEHVVVKIFLCTIAQYVDDFPHLKLKALEDPGSGTDLVDVLDLLGWGGSRR